MPQRNVDAQIVYLAREDPTRPVRLISDLGSRLPAHCSALCNALLASLSDDEVNAILPRQLPAVTAHTITRKQDLLAAPGAIRRSGLAREREEATAGIACFAAFVGVTALGKRVAVSVSLPLERLDARREKRLAIAVVEMAQRIGKSR